MFAKGKEPPSVASTRVLRTHRLNEVEAFRLLGKMRTIDNESQSNYSQISDEIDGVRKSLLSVKKIKDNLNISVERRKLLRERGVFVIPSFGLEYEGVTLRRSDGKKVVIRGKECYDGEIIRKCIDVSFDSSNSIDLVRGAEEEDNDANDRQCSETEPHEKTKLFHYRIIVPPFRPGSRRNFKEYEEDEEDQQLLDFELLPSEDHTRNRFKIPSFRVRPQTAAHPQKERRQGHTRPKSHMDLHSQSKSTHENIRREEETQTIDRSQACQESALTYGTQEKEKHLRPKPSDIEEKRMRKSTDSDQSIYGSTPRDHRTESQKPQDPEDKKYSKYSTTDSHNSNARQTKTLDPSSQDEREKLLKKRLPVEDGGRLHLENHVSEEIQTEIQLETPPHKPGNLESLSTRRPNEATKISEIKTSIQSDNESHPARFPTRKQSSQMSSNDKSHYIKDDHSIMSYSSKTSNSVMRKSTESFNCNAISNTNQGPGKGHRKSSVGFAGTSDRRSSVIRSEDFIYDARPDKALSKGYTTMQMTIGGKQVQICVPKFSNDDVIERARAKSAAQMADERTRGVGPTKPKLILSKN